MMNPIEELASVLDGQVKKTVSASKTLTFELGTIVGNMALSVSSLSNNIPKGEYMVSFRLTTGSLTFKTKVEENHAHSITLPSQFRGLQVGDRVLVAWVGTEPIVIDIVVSS